jgi:predicted O-linked N-acetylglucosamine transferase (SPINDLY family)
MLKAYADGPTAQTLALAVELTKRYPQDGFGWKVLGALAKQQGNHADALQYKQKAVELAPNDPEAHLNLGITLQALSRMSEAESAVRQAIALNPDFAEAHCQLAVLLFMQGQIAEAEACCSRALTLKPDLAEAHYHLGAIRLRQSCLQDAEAYFRRALQLRPAYYDALNSLGVTLNALNQSDSAEACFRRAIQLHPSLAAAYSNLGNTLTGQGQGESHLNEAEACFRQALSIKPDFAEAASNLLFLANYQPDRTATEVWTDYANFDVQFGLPHHQQWRPHINDRTLKRRLKVGYLSPDFRHHACRSFLLPLLENHDPSVVEIFAYAEMHVDDELTRRYKEVADHWTVTIGISDDDLAERIRADQIDILVDLAGHTANNRLPVFARKPAPVSVSWLGHGYSTGLTAIDYYFVDVVSAPPGSQAVFSETLWPLKGPQYAYRATEGMGTVGPLPALTRGWVTFGTLTRAIRINYRTISVWSAILHRVPRSRLVVDSRNFESANAQNALAARFAEHGIKRDRLEIGYHSPPWDVLREIDIGLDCFPHNSGTTLFETLYMGVPFVTLAGRPTVGRLGSSILHGVGHPEWVATTEDEYVEKVVALAGQLPRLASIRAGLRQEMEACPLMNERVFAHSVESAYREMFIKWATTSREKSAPPAKNYLTNEFFGVRDGPAFISALQTTIHQVPGSGVWAGDNLFTFGRNLSFLDDQSLMTAVATHADTVTEKAILWRTAVLVWAARHALKLDGDFVECACYRGTTARILIDALGLQHTDKRYYLYDSFASDPRTPDITSDQFEAHVRSRFAEMPNVIVTAGYIPQVLERVAPEKISLLHLDLNNAAAEIGALEKLFHRMVPGAMLILDDYGWIQYREQKLQEDAFFAERGYSVLELPTGQGMVIR